MFKRPTTIIVGAGCSKEYGLPLGDELRLKISKLLAGVKVQQPQRNSGFVIVGGSSGIDGTFNDAVQRAGGAEWRAWFKIAQQMSNGLKHASSIDRYLDIHRDNEAMVLIGKMAIGRKILLAERRSSLATAATKGLMLESIDKTAGGPNWLAQLFLRLQEGARRDNFADVLSNVTFICFNYDRVIEHYLYHAISDITGYGGSDLADIMSRLEIYHPYGSLGRLPWQRGEDPSVPFGADTDDARDIEAIASRLRVFTETIEDSEELMAMRNAIADAEQVIFLGFSFLDQNMRLITPEGRGKCTRCFATMFGESGYNMEAAKEAMDRMLNGSLMDQFHAFKPRIDQSRAGEFIAAAGNLLRT